jgi:hypothetical protein
LRLIATVLAVLAALLLAVGSAAAARPSRVTTVVPRASTPATTRSLAVAAPLEVPVSAHVTLVGLRWRGSLTPDVRYARYAGDRRLGPWTALRPGDDGARVAGRDPTRYSSPIWMDGARSLRLSVGAGVRDLRAIVVDPGTNPPGLGRLLATAHRRAVAARRDGTPVQPTIVTRAEWGADESIRRTDPGYAPAVGYAIVHHTDNPNTYTAAEAPAVVRSIYLYHVRSNGWNDIGYNALVDRYGVIYEGRYGGIDRPVIGAQAQGFNTGSVGVALIGTYQTEAPPAVQIASLESYLAWRLDVAHVNPLAPITVVSGGSGSYPAGTSVAFPRSIVGHRDTGPTDCPGAVVYAMLPAIAQAVDALGGLRIFSPASSSGSLDTGAVRFTAALSRASPWTVTVRTSAGTPVWSSSGVGTAVDATWTPTAAELGAPGSLTWEIDAADATGAARPATGTLAGASATVAITGPTTLAVPAAGGRITIPLSVALTVSGSLVITIQDGNGVVVRTLPPAVAGIGATTSVWDGLTDAGALAPSGVYTAVATLTLPGGQTILATTTVRLEHGLAAATLSRSLVSPNGDGRADGTLLRLQRSEPTLVVVSLLQRGRSVRRLSSTRTGPGPASIPLRLGSFRDGTYQVRVVSTGAGGTVTMLLRLVLDRSRPALTLKRVGQTHGLVSVRFRISQRATVTLRSGHRAVVVTVVGPGPVILHARASTLVGVLRLTAQDAAGNRALPLRFRR